MMTAVHTFEAFDGDDSPAILKAVITTEGVDFEIGGAGVGLDATRSIDLARAILAVVAETDGERPEVEE